MLTYSFKNVDGPIYEYIYHCIKEDILQGKLSPNEKLPSKRSFAKNHGISTITVQNAYDQLIGEGFLYTIAKKGYYVSELDRVEQDHSHVQNQLNIKKPEMKEILFDFSSNATETDSFPFSIWARVMRETISLREKDLMKESFCGGVYELRLAIANHLSSYRGMLVDPDQIIVGAGTEYLYGLLVKLLGRDQIYCIENPGYSKLKKIYETNHAKCAYANMDEKGIMIEELEEADAQIAHISPNHHFPTGITMPISRRYELLAWANATAKRYIIEDDYDSEFRYNGKPIPTLQSIDTSGKVIYMNTFSKSLTSTIRISYMVLPEELVNDFYEKLSFYSCTVSNFEQYSLAAFIEKGYFEKHINRMRLYYGRKRTDILDCIRRVLSEEECHIIENNAGLHFLLELNTEYSDQEIKKRLLEEGIQIRTVMEFDQRENVKDSHRFILNYSSMDTKQLETALVILKKAMQ